MGGRSPQVNQSFGGIPGSLFQAMGQQQQASIERSQFDPNSIPGFSDIGNNSQQKTDFLNQHGVGAFGPVVDSLFQRLDARHNDPFSSFNNSQSPFTGFGKNGPQNQFQPNTSNPFLTGTGAPGALSFDSAQQSAAQQNAPRSSPFRRGVGNRGPGLELGSPRGLIGRF